MGNRNINRRDLLAVGGIGALGLGGIEAVLPGQGYSAEAGGSSTPAELSALNRFPRMVQEWLVSQVREAEDRGNTLRSAVRTNQDAQDYVASCRERIKKCLCSGDRAWDSCAGDAIV